MRRNNRRYGRGYGGSQMSLSVLIIIILFAVATGYAGTKYIIYPYLLNGQEQEQQKEDAQKKDQVQDSGVSAITSLPGVLVDGQDIPDEKEKKKEESNKTEEKKTDAKSTVEDEGKVTSTTADANKNQTANATSEEKAKQSSPTNTGSGAFSLQFGNFTEKTGAAQRVKELNEKGINAYVFESGGSYRVLGNTYDSKEKAKQAADIISNSAVEVFVVDMKTFLQ